MLSVLAGLGLAGWSGIGLIVLILAAVAAWQHGRSLARLDEEDERRMRDPRPDAAPKAAATPAPARAPLPALEAAAHSRVEAEARAPKPPAAPQAEARGGFPPGQDEVSPLELHRARVAQRTEAFAQARGSTVITIVHHGYEDYVDTDTAIDAIDRIREAPADGPIDVILHTPGGIASATQQILHALKHHAGRKTAFVPYRAKSAGTMIALACDEIVMGSSAVLGPIDPQYFWMPAHILAELPNQKNADRMDDEMIILSKMAQQALTESRRFACDFVNPAHRKDGTCSLTDDLIGGGRNHDYPILPHEAVEFGLNVSTAMPEDGYAICKPPPKEDPMLIVSMFNSPDTQTQKPETPQRPTRHVFR